MTIPDRTKKNGEKQDDSRENRMRKTTQSKTHCFVRDQRPDDNTPPASSDLKTYCWYNDVNRPAAAKSSEEDIVADLLAAKWVVAAVEALAKV